MNQRESQGVETVVGGGDEVAAIVDDESRCCLSERRKLDAAFQVARRKTLGTVYATPQGRRNAIHINQICTDLDACCWAEHDSAFLSLDDWHTKLLTIAARTSCGGLQSSLVTHLASLPRRAVIPMPFTPLQPRLQRREDPCQQRSRN